MDQHVGATVVLRYEAVALDDVEPFDATADFDDLKMLAGVVGGLDVAAG